MRTNAVEIGEVESRIGLAHVLQDLIRPLRGWEGERNPGSLGRARRGTPRKRSNRN
jgi:hypothetical protein